MVMSGTMMTAEGIASPISVVMVSRGAEELTDKSKAVTMAIKTPLMAV